VAAALDGLPFEQGEPEKKVNDQIKNAPHEPDASASPPPSAETTPVPLPSREAEAAISLHHAAEKDDASELARLLDLKGDPNMVLRGLTMVTWASMRGSCNAVTELLSRRANADVQEAKDGNTALHFAVRAQRKGVVSALLSGKADAEISNHKGDTALSSALQRNLCGVVEMIVAGHTEGREEALRKAHTINYRHRGYTPLLQAIELGDDETAMRIVRLCIHQASSDPIQSGGGGRAEGEKPHGGGQLVARTKKGVSPLMMACQFSPRIAALLLESLLVQETVALRSTNHHSAQDYARLGGFQELGDQLAVLEQAQEVPRCPVCKVQLKKSNKLRFLRESIAAERRIKLSQEDATQEGREGEGEGKGLNPLLDEFFKGPAAGELEKPEFHALNEQVSLRKEITESMAIYTAIQSVLENPSEPLHVIDLCCGRSWTTAFIATRHPDVIVTPIDRFPSSFLPHYGRHALVHYKRMDLFDTEFLRDLEAHINRVGRKVLLVGMHLCGHLSTVAIDVFHSIPLVVELLLCPCCLPNQKDEASPGEIYRSKDSQTQYKAWVEHLALCPYMVITAL